jgi:predicted anti-sigma-YlaC factor YlaD
MKSLQGQGASARCQKIREQLSVGETKLRALFHLARCSECRAFRRAVRSQRADLKAITDVTPSRGLKERTMEAIDQESEGEGRPSPNTE